MGSLRFVLGIGLFAFGCADTDDGGGDADTDSDTDTLLDSDCVTELGVNDDDFLADTYCSRLTMLGLSAGTYYIRLEPYAFGGVGADPNWEMKAAFLP